MTRYDVIVVAKLVAFLALIVAGIIVGAGLFGCGCPRIGRPNVTDYPTSKKEALRTAMGAYIVPNGNYVSGDMLKEVDYDIDEVLACIKRNYPKYYRDIDYSCFVIVLADDWRVACEDPNQQVFGEVPHEACELKGFEEKEGCKCGMRVVIQSGKYVVTTPNLYMLPAGIVEIVTGWQSVDIYEDNKMAECAAPLKTLGGV